MGERRYSFTPRPIYLQVNSLQYPLLRRLAAFQTGLDAVAKREIPDPARNRTPVVQTTA